MRKEYDFGDGIRGKYVQRYVESNAVFLDPDVAAVYKNSESVNAALRKEVGLAPRKRGARIRTEEE